MIDSLFGPLRPRADTLARLNRQDFPLHVSAIVGTVVILALVGYGLLGVVFGLMMLVFEVLTRRLGQSLADPVCATSGRIALVWGLAVVNSTTFTLPAVLLANEDSVALMLAGMMWLFGVQANVSHAFSRFPIFLVGLSAPLVAGIAVSLWLAAGTQHQPATLGEWMLAGFMAFICLYSNFVTVVRKSTVEKALARVRSEAAERLERLETLHKTDPLTGLLNRAAFDDCLASMLTARGTVGNTIAVIMIDLDSFKPINDTYSHEAGDTVLSETANRIRAIAEPNGIIGRPGGDEFIIAISDVASKEAAVKLANQIAAAISKPIAWDGRVLTVHSSVGIALANEQHLYSVSEICSAADQAMFRTKSSPNGAPSLYDPKLFAPRMSLSDRQRLADAVHNGQIKPYYQPKVYLPTGEVTGFEALARWEHPDRGLLLPGAFLKEIDESGLQGDLLARMAHQIAADVETLLDQGLDPGQISINVPEVALATHTGQKELEQVLLDHPHARCHLTFEITEDVFIARAAEAIQASISVFRNLGVRISLDDFGTGFASFHHLRQLDFDELKIDTSFVRSLGSDPASEVLVQGFLSIASGLGVSVIAEGVETEAQRRDLLGLGCITAQGFLFSKAVPFAKARDLLVQSQTGQPSVQPQARAVGAPPLSGRDGPDRM